MSGPTVPIPAHAGGIVTIQPTLPGTYVFELLADGPTVKEIAQALFISPKTVESHKYHIMAKLEVDSITEMTKLAIREKVIEP